MAPSGGVALLAHGAGGHQNHSHILDLSAMLRDLGLAVVRFDFPYRAKGKGPPDPMPRLIQTVSAVAEEARKVLAPRFLILSGHSMGGRAASMAAAEGLACDGLLLFSYPWHPPGKTDKPRTAHLDRIGQPALVFTGTRDAFCDRKAMAENLRKLSSRLTLHWLEGADHGLEVLKKSGRSREEVMAEVSGAVGNWLNANGWTGVRT